MMRVTKATEKVWKRVPLPVSFMTVGAFRVRSFKSKQTKTVSETVTAGFRKRKVKPGLRVKSRGRGIKSAGGLREGSPPMVG